MLRPRGPYNRHHRLYPWRRSRCQQYNCLISQIASRDGLEKRRPVSTRTQAAHEPFAPKVSSVISFLFSTALDGRRQMRQNFAFEISGVGRRGGGFVSQNRHVVANCIWHRTYSRQFFGCVRFARLIFPRFAVIRMLGAGLPTPPVARPQVSRFLRSRFASGLNQICQLLRANRFRQLDQIQLARCGRLADLEERVPDRHQTWPSPPWRTGLTVQSRALSRVLAWTVVCIRIKRRSLDRRRSTAAWPRCDEPFSTTKNSRSASLYGFWSSIWSTKRPKGSMPVFASQRPSTMPRRTSQAARYCNAPVLLYSGSIRRRRFDLGGVSV
jgi:hypothetical protein